jgi:tetrahydromethanopterin S-methyltransferase subunit D
MKKALPANSKSTVVQGRIIYVCCPPCIDKIKADPATHIKAVDALYAAHVKAREDRQR